MYDLGKVIARVKVEIEQDIAAGVVPAEVRSFAELHDHVDANQYGGAAAWPSEEWSTDRFCAFWNRVQNAVDVWLKAGRPAAQPRSHWTEWPGTEVPTFLDELVQGGQLEDTSWSNDSSASFEAYRDQQGIRVWVQDRSPRDREMGGSRFLVSRLIPSSNGWNLVDNDELLCETDSEDFLEGWLDAWLQQ